MLMMATVISHFLSQKATTNSLIEGKFGRNGSHRLKFSNRPSDFPGDAALR